MESDLELWKRMVEARLTSLEARFQAGTGLGAANQKPLSLAEFLKSKCPKTGLDKAIAIAYFLEKHEKMSSFSLADLRRGFVSAKEALPANSRDLVHRALKSGLMMETGGEREGFRALTLTNSGERYVENRLKAEE